MRDDDVRSAKERGVAVLLEVERARVTGAFREIRDLAGMPTVDLIAAQARRDVDDHLDGEAR